MADDDLREQQDYNNPHGIIFASMLEAEIKAWEALAGYKFWMFGYHAARWVNYNSLLPKGIRLRSPFTQLVKFGRSEAERRQEQLPTLERQLALLSPPEKSE